MIALRALWLLATGLAYLSVVVSPAVFWPAAFVAMFGVPIAVLANVGLLLLALVRKWNRAWIWLASFCLLMGYPFLHATLGTGGSEPSPDGVPGLKIISYNTGNFLGQTGSDRLDTKRENATAMREWLQHSGADVLVLQEVFNYPIVPEFRILHNLKKGGYKYRYWSRLNRHADTVGAGMVILSRLPLTHGKVVFARPGSNNQILSADVRVGGRTVRILNAHLASIRLTYEDMALRRSPSRLWSNIQRTVKKMRVAYVHRARQVEALRYEIGQSPYPILLCGDFNDTPYSYSYWQMRRLLRSSFEKAGTGLGNTYNGKFRFGLRIDHQFVSDSIQVSSLHVAGKVRYSDHLPLVGTYYLEPR